MYLQNSRIYESDVFVNSKYIQAHKADVYIQKTVHKFSQLAPTAKTKLA